MGWNAHIPADQDVGDAWIGRRTLAYRWIGATAELSARRGVPIHDALLRGGVAPDASAIRDDTPIGAAEFHLICNTLIAMHDDELHGASRRGMPRGTGALGLRILSSAGDLRTAITMLLKFYGMVGTFCDFTFHEAEGLATITILSRDAAQNMSAIVEEVMANWLQIQLCYVMQMPIRLSGFTTRSTDHPCLGRMHPFFNCPVMLGDKASVSFSSGYLGLAPKARINGAPLGDSVFYWLRQMAEIDSHQLPDAAQRPLSLAVLELLRSDPLSFQECADAMDCQERELRQGLFLEGSSFRQLRRIALIDRVRPWFQTGACMDDIADRLGYSDARSLRRGLKLATGLSLAELRQMGTPDQAMGSPAVLGALRASLAHSDALNA